MNKIKKTIAESFDNYRMYKSFFLYSQLKAMIILTAVFSVYAIIMPIAIRLFVSGYSIEKVRVEFSVLGFACFIPCVGFIYIYFSKKINDNIKGVVYEFLMLFIFFTAIVIYPNIGLENARAAGEYADYTIYFLISLIVLITFIMHPIHYVFAYGIATGFVLKTVMGLDLNSNKQIFNLIIFCVTTAVLYVLKYHINLNSYLKSVQIEKMQKSREQFLVSLTHEMRTPLNAVLGKNQMILADTHEEETRKLARQANSSGQMLLSLINDILDQSKLESGKMNIISSEYHPHAMIADIGSIMKTVAEENGLEYIEEVSDNIPASLCGDEIRIKQIMLNLISNGIKYTKTGSVSLKVSFDKKGDHSGFLNVSVVDTGIGIKEENIPKLTEAFVRVDEGKNKYIQGTGLGLSITSSLLQMMGSRLEIESVYGEGSSFSFKIEQGIPDNNDAGSVEECTETKSYPNAKILVVDDNKVNNSVIKGLLKKNSIVSDYANGGIACLEKVANQKYDLIFLDHMMPDMDGIETLSRLKNDYPDRIKDTVIVALTANYASNAQSVYEGLGFDSYLAKPVDAGKLNAILNRYL